MLRRRAARLAAAELDPGLDGQLAARLAGSNAAVVRADAACLPFAAGSFSAVACLTMLHHIPSARQQDTALAEIARVLRPGGLLAGSSPMPASRSPQTACASQLPHLTVVNSAHAAVCAPGRYCQVLGGQPG